MTDFYSCPKRPSGLHWLRSKVANASIVCTTPQTEAKPEFINEGDPDSVMNLNEEFGSFGIHMWFRIEQLGVYSSIDLIRMRRSGTTRLGSQMANNCDQAGFYRDSEDGSLITGNAVSDLALAIHPVPYTVSGERHYLFTLESHTNTLKDYISYADPVRIAEISVPTTILPQLNKWNWISVFFSPRADGYQVRIPAPYAKINNVIHDVTLIADSPVRNAMKHFHHPTSIVLFGNAPEGMSVANIWASKFYRDAYIPTQNPADNTANNAAVKSFLDADFAGTYPNYLGVDGRFATGQPANIAYMPFTPNNSPEETAHIPKNFLYNNFSYEFSRFEPEVDISDRVSLQFSTSQNSVIKIGN